MENDGDINLYVIDKDDGSVKLEVIYLKLSKFSLAFDQFILSICMIVTYYSFSDGQIYM